MSARQEALSTIEISDNSEGFLFSEAGFLKFTPDRKNLIAACNAGAIIKYSYNIEDGLANMTDLADLKLPLNERIAMISVSNSCDFAFASEGHDAVKLCKLEGGKYEASKLVTKINGGKVLAVAIDPQGKLLCCSGDDNITKIINIGDSDFPVLGQIPSSHFVRSISFSENGKHLAFLQVDGMLRLYKIVENNPVPQLYQTLSGIKGDLNGKFQVCWGGEDCLGVLYGSKTVRVYQLGSEKWEIKTEYSAASDIINFEMLSNELLLISTADDSISLFSVTRDKILTSTKWADLDKSSLAAANESFACVFEPSRGDLFKITIKFDAKDLIVPVDVKKKRNKKLQQMSAKRIKSKYIDDSVSDDEDGAEEQEDDEDDEMSDNQDLEDISENGVDLDFDEDLSTRSNACDSVNDSEFGALEPETPVFKKHPVVQPCCTEWRNLQRYLAYNNHGFVTARSSLEDESVFNYDIEFMDRSANNPIRFEDKIAYNLASLSEKGAVFASNGTGACLHFVSFKSSEESWTSALTLGSEPILVGVSNNYVYLVNDRGIMNIYTLTGLLRSTVMCPGRPISLICGDEEVFLFTDDLEGILCHRLNPKNGGLLQSSRVLLYTVDSVQLVWCGLSFSGVLGSFTSTGKFSILLNRDGCDRWTEILNCAGENVKVWPVYFDVNTLSGVACTLDEKYPDPYPSPHVLDYPFKIPELTNDPSFEEVFRTNLMLNETNSSGLTDREKKKMFATSERILLELALIFIKTNLGYRLSDLAHLTANEKIIDKLIQMAQHYNLPSAAEEIELIKSKLLKKEQEQEIKVKATTLPLSMPSSINPDVTMVAMSPVASANWATPKLPELVAKESPSGILANLTPMKSGGIETAATIADVASSPAGIIDSPSTTTSNPFAKSSANENQNSENSGDSNAMQDYIKAMMQLNNKGNKKKGSNLGSNVFTAKQ